MVTIGLVGCGTIGTKLAQEIQRRFKGIARLIGFYDHDPQKAARLSRRFHPAVPFLFPKQIIARCDLLIEAASAQAVEELLLEVIRQRKSILIMSTGGLLRHQALLRKAHHRRIPVYLPSGALVGLDGVKAGAIGKIRSVTLTTRKPPAAFTGAPAVIQKKISLSSIRRPRLLFQGTAQKAVAAFPQNINVAATLALAGVGPKKTRVRIIADPTIHENIHEIEAQGEFGRFIARTENRPARENPKTSRLAVFSAVATLQQILQPVRVGT